MPDSEHYRRLERMYLAGPINQNLYKNNTIKVEKEQATISTEVTAMHFHAAGAMHGSVYFKLLDDAAFFAVNSIVRDCMLYTVSFNLNFLKPVGPGIVKSIGQVKYKTRSLFVAESHLYDSQGKLAAFGSGNFMRSPFQLSDLEDYI